MIVKNESKIIRRLLESVLPIIDSFCICDTGSTDDTIQIIQSFFEQHKIVGKIIKEPFRDFGYNRSHSLAACTGMINADYILLMDADMILVTHPTINIKEFKKILTSDVYYLYQGSSTFSYKNVRLVKNRPGQSYWGVTHEYFKSIPDSVYSDIDKSLVFIEDIGDGGSKTNKFERDIKLLLKGLEDEPNNDRYTFYLANTYRDLEDFDNAISYYKKRIEIGGWEQEVWLSYFNIGLCYKNMKDMPNAIFYWLEAYDYYPERIENLYELTLYYRQLGKYKLAYQFYEMADYHRKTTDFSKTHLFIFNNIYEYQLDYEITVIGHYYNRNQYNIHEKCLTVLSHPNVQDYICDNIFSNYKFFDNVLCGTPSSISTSNMKLLTNIGKEIITDPMFIASTPSICMDNNKRLIINQRFVSYRIDDTGAYINQPNIITKNVFVKVNMDSSNWKIMDEFLLDYDTSKDDLYVGQEDIRLFPFYGEIMFTANRGISHENIVVEYGTINKNKKLAQSKVVERTSDIKPVEKNWVLFKTGSNVKMIHSWYPIQIGSIVEQSNYEFIVTNEIKTPTFFRWVRGSTNGVNLNGEIWFICHIVSHETRRYYYHLFVVLDEVTLEVKKYSRLFTFEKQPVEYTLGFVHFKETDEFLIGYSVMDREPRYTMVSKSHIDTLFLL